MRIMTIATAMNESSANRTVNVHFLRINGITGKAMKGSTKTAPKITRPPSTAMTTDATAVNTELRTKRMKPAFSDSGAGVSILDTRAKMRKLNRDAERPGTVRGAGVA